jgi:hypothetical protein
MRTISQGILLLVKIKICMWLIRSVNIIDGKNLHNKITSKSLHSQLFFIKISVSTFVYRQHINILRDKIRPYYIYSFIHYLEHCSHYSRF